MNSPYNFADLFKNAVDFSQLPAIQRRNFEAWSEANKAVVEGVQAITRLQAEMVRENVEQALQASRELMTSGTPETNLSKQAEFAKEAFENALSNAREVTEMLTKSSFEAFDLLNKRASESLEEISRAAGANGAQQQQKKKASA